MKGVISAALLILLVFLILTIWFTSEQKIKKSISIVLVMLLVAGLVLFVSTACRGGELVYRYGLGILSLPQVANKTDNGHNHGVGVDNKVFSP